jgi:glycosyltransferase involved in cell wall biosynthesis
MASGKLVVSSKNTAIPEFVCNGSTGILIDDELKADDFKIFIEDENKYNSIVENSRISMLKIDHIAIAKEEGQLLLSVYTKFSS